MGGLAVEVCSPPEGRMPTIVSGDHPGAYGVVFALPLDQALLWIKPRRIGPRRRSVRGGRTLANVNRHTARSELSSPACGAISAPAHSERRQHRASPLVIER